MLLQELFTVAVSSSSIWLFIKPFLGRINKDLSKCKYVTCSELKGQLIGIDIFCSDCAATIVISEIWDLQRPSEQAGKGR